MEEVKFLTGPELETGLDHIRQSPVDQGTVELIVCRPQREQRKVLTEGRIDIKEGLIGDSWFARSREANKDPEDQLGRQITLMNSRCVALLAGNPDRAHAFLEPVQAVGGDLAHGAHRTLARQVSPHAQPTAFERDLRIEQGQSQSLA